MPRRLLAAPLLCPVGRLQHPPLGRHSHGSGLRTVFFQLWIGVHGNWAVARGVKRQEFPVRRSFLPSHRRWERAGTLFAGEQGGAVDGLTFGAVSLPPEGGEKAVGPAGYDNQRRLGEYEFDES